jgi:hypothetical protein
VQRLTRLAHAVDHLAPGVAAEHPAVGDRSVHQLRALIEDTARAERVVAHLAVAHVVVAGHAHRRAVRA